MKKNKILNIILVLLCAVFAFSAFMVARTVYLSYKHTKNFNKISALAPLPPLTDEDNAQVTTFFDTLYAQNPDIAAYLTIPDTQIDYPVMLTPSDPEYYLRRDFDKNYSYYGTPFFEDDCREDGGVKIIHGHHITGKKMFGELLYYRDYDFLTAHSDVHLYDSTGDNVYTVFAAFYTTGDDKDDIYTRGANGLYTKEDFDDYVNKIKSLATAKNDDTELEIGDEILLLSTCEYTQHVGRFVVAAVKHN